MNTIKLNTIGTPCKAGGNSGGGNGGGGSASSVEYWDVSGVEDGLRSGLPAFALEIKYIDEETTCIAGGMAALTVALTRSSGLRAISIRKDRNIIFKGDLSGTILDINAPFNEAMVYLGSQLGIPITLEQLDAIPRITEEEFYTL